MKEALYGFEFIDLAMQSRRGGFMRELKPKLKPDQT
jgi:hypothetical protein